eukprot:g3570.t1
MGTKRTKSSATSTGKRRRYNKNDRVSSSSSSSSTSRIKKQPVKVTLSQTDRATKLKLSDDNLIVYGSPVEGYRSIRSTHGVSEGCWYFEVVLAKRQSDRAHVRVGWSTKKANLEFPVGHAANSFAIRDVDGDKISNACRLPYTKKFGTWGNLEGFTWNKSSTERRKENSYTNVQGDVIGVLLRLPVTTPHLSASTQRILNSQLSGLHIPEEWKKKFDDMSKLSPVNEGSVIIATARAAAFSAAAACAAAEAVTCAIEALREHLLPNSFFVHESKISLDSNTTDVAAPYKSSTLQNISPMPSTVPKKKISTKNDFGEIHFFINGKSCGVAFNQVPSGRKYYPTISLFMGAVVQARFGPFFPKKTVESLESTGLKAMPMSVAVGEAPLAV